MWRLQELAEREINNFGGVFYADPNLDGAMELYKTDRTVIVGMKNIMLGALAMGIRAISMTMMNLVPEWSVELYEHMMNNQLKEALVVQEKIVRRTQELLAHDEHDMINKMKMEFNKLNTSFKMGPTRAPMGMMMRPMM